MPTVGELLGLSTTQEKTTQPKKTMTVAELLASQKDIEEPGPLPEQAGPPKPSPSWQSRVVDVVDTIAEPLGLGGPLAPFSHAQKEAAINATAGGLTNMGAQGLMAAGGAAVGQKFMPGRVGRSVGSATGMTLYEGLMDAVEAVHKREMPVGEFKKLVTAFGENLLISGLTEGVSTLTSKSGRALRSEGRMEDVAKEAGAKADDIARKTTAAEDLAQGEHLADVYQKAREAQSTLQSVADKADDELASKMAEVHQTALKETRRTAKDALVEQATGRTQAVVDAGYVKPLVPGQTGAMVPSQQALAQSRTAMDAFGKPRGKIQAEYDQRYVAYLKNAEGKRLDPAPMQQAANEEMAWIQKRGQQFSSETLKVFQKVADFSKKEGVTPSAILDERGTPILLPTKPPQLPTAHQIFGVRSEARELLKRPDMSSIDKEALNHLVDQSTFVLNKALPNSQALDFAYAKHLDTFGSDFHRAVLDAKTPDDFAKILFDNPDRGNRLIQNASPQDRATFRGIFGDWYIHAKANGKDISKELTRDHGIVLEGLFGKNHPLGNPDSWIYTDKAIDKFSDLAQSSKAVGDKYWGIVHEEARKMKGQLDEGLVKVAESTLPKAGPEGRKLLAQIKVARTPEEQSALIRKTITNPEFAQKSTEAVGQQMPPPNVNVPNAIMQQFPAGTTPKLGFPIEAATTKEEAMIHAVRSQQQKAYTSWYLKSLPFHASMAVIELSMGQLPLHWLRAEVALGAGAGIKSYMTNAFRKSLEYPAKARAFVNATNNPGTKSSLHTLGRLTVEGMLSSGVKTGLKEMDMAPDFGPPQQIELPETDNSDRRSQAADVYLKTAQGEVPDITQALREGRLSGGDAVDILRQMKAV